MFANPGGGGSGSGPSGGGSGQTSNNPQTNTTATPAKSKNPCPDSGGVTDPIIPSTGNKIETITDFAMPGEMGLNFTRYYISRTVHGSTVMGGWTDNLDYELHYRCLSGDPASCTTATFMRPDGSFIAFNSGSTAGPGKDVIGPFTEIGGGGHATLTYDNSGDGLPGTYTLVDEDAKIYTYSEDLGQSNFYGLISIRDVSGVGWSIRHQRNSAVTTVYHTSGQVMKLTTSTSGTLSVLTVTDPANNDYVYQSTPNWNITFNLLPSSLGAVIFPGSVPTTVTYKYTNLIAGNGLSAAIQEVDYNGVAHDVTTYDSAGRANSGSMADGTQKTSIVYSSNSTGPVATITNPSGHVAVYQYNASAELLSITGQASSLCAASFAKNTYDANGNLQTATDNNGNTTQYTYAATGQLQQKVEGVGTSVARTTNYVWDTTPGTDRLLSVTVVGWSQTTYTYNAQNRLATVSVKNLSVNGVSGQTLTTTYQYALYANGMVQTLSIIHPSPGNSNTDVYRYDTMGNLVSVANGLGQSTTYSNYNALGEPQQVVGPNGDTANYTYDVRGRVATKTTYPYGIAGSWTYTYDGFGLLYTLTTPDNEVTTWNRNAYMQVTSITRNDKDGASTESFVYDAMGNVTSDVVARGSTLGLSTSVVYDPLGRPYQHKGANGQVETYTYDGNDNLLSMTDALGNKTSFQYDALDRKTRMIDANNGITQLTYDAANDVVSLTDPRGLVTSYAYDGLGQLWQQTSPDTGTTHYAYDSYGRRSTMTRADGTQTTYGFDGLNRTTSIGAGGQIQSFTYDSCTNGKGRLCAASDATGTTSYTYTPEGWVSGRGFSISGTTYALGFNYDAEGRLTVVTYPDGNKAVYYLTNGAVNSLLLVVGGTNVWGASAVAYRPADTAMASWNSSNGLTNTLGYDTDGRLTSIGVPGIQSQSFAYDAADRITHIGNGIDSSMTETLGYDALSRVTSMSSGAENESYQYDADGNRVSAVVNGISETFTPDVNSNRMVGFHNPYFGTVQYGFDAQGNSTSANGTTANQYNPFNRLAQSGGATFYINPEGQRLRKAGGSTGTTYFAPAPSGALLAENDNGTWVDYVRLNGRLIGRISGGQVDAIHTDQVDRPDTVTDASQHVIWHAKNYPFGSTVTLANISLNLGFPGQYYDAETWLWNNGYRDYNSGFGRYVESDPIGLNGGINTYAYVGNNPLSLVDPLGLCDQQKCTAARALVASLGQQLSAEGKVTTWTGIGLVAASGIGAIFAPEGAPAEVAGAETGAGLIDVGGVISTIGGTMTAYASGGARNAAVALVGGLVISKINQGAAGWGAASGVSEANQAAVSGLLDQSSEAVLEQEAACNAQ